MTNVINTTAIERSPFKTWRWIIMLLLLSIISMNTLQYYSLLDGQEELIEQTLEEDVEDEFVSDDLLLLSDSLGNETSILITPEKKKQWDYNIIVVSFIIRGTDGPPPEFI